MPSIQPVPASLALGQQRFIRTLNEGPAALPQDLFHGSDNRIILGLKTHANTISHARLVALEETFPRTRARLGEERFNAVSRAFVDQPVAQRCKLWTLGEEFPAFLAEVTEPRIDICTQELAAIEWAWLQSYHAADCDALALADLASHDEASLLGLPIALHPASRCIALSVPPAAELGEVAAQSEFAAAVLIVRPDVEVCLVPLSPARAAVCHAAQNAPTMGNLLECAIEQSGEAEALRHVFALIEAGMLTRQGD